jgi:hypothetical protein
LVLGEIDAVQAATGKAEEPSARVVIALKLGALDPRGGNVLVLDAETRWRAARLTADCSLP